MTVLGDQTMESSGGAAPASGQGNLLADVAGRAGAMFRIPRVGRRGVVLLAAFVVVAWGLSGIYKVGSDEQGVVLRFGRWVDTAGPGLHYRLPYPITTILLPKITNVNEMRSGAFAPPPDPARPGAAPNEASRMLTGDENIVEADYSVLWKIKDAGAFLFHVQDPEGMIRMVAETTVRAVIGRNPIQAVLSDRRQQIAVEVQSELQRLLDDYGVGVLIIQVQLQRVDPPASVIDAFNDVQRARADQARSRNEAEAYRNDILPHARGEAEHIIQDAEAYRTEALDQAKGDVSAFLAAQTAYQAAPEVYTWRLYLDSMDQLMRRASRVFIDASGKGIANMVPYMPLGELPAKRPAYVPPNQQDPSGMMRAATP